MFSDVDLNLFFDRHPSAQNERGYNTSERQMACTRRIQ